MVDIFYGHGFLEPHPLPVHGHSSPTNAISSLISLNEILLRLMHSFKFSLLSAWMMAVFFVRIIVVHGIRSDIGDGVGGNLINEMFLF